MPRVTNADILDAVQQQNEQLRGVNEKLAELNGSVRNHDKRMVVLEDHDQAHCHDIEVLQDRERNLALEHAKSAGIGGVVGAVVGALVQIIPHIINVLK